MPIFDLKNNKAKQVYLDLNHFKSEASLRDFFAENLEGLLGMRFLAKEYPTTDGRVDTLAIDDNNSPVIIEYKLGQDNAVFVQGLFYLNWLKNTTNRKHIDLLVADKFGKEIAVNWSNPRVILITQGFDNRTIDAAQQVSNVELIKYTPYSDDILYLENIYVPKAKQILVREGKGAGERKQKSSEVYDLNFHLNRRNSTETVKEIFYRLREKVTSLANVEEVVEQKTGITYKTTKSFTRFEFGKTFIDILLRDPHYNDPLGLVRDIESFEWGYKGMMKIRSLDEIDSIFELIEQSYRNTI